MSANFAADHLQPYMTQQELFDKLSALLAPSGYRMRLVGNWRYGDVQFNVPNFEVFAHAFTHADLLEAIADSLAYLRERMEEEDEEEDLKVDEREIAFLHALRAALETFPEEERHTVIHYTFNQPLFDFLKEKLAADKVTVTFEPNAADERYSYVLFDVHLPQLQFRVFPIYGRCFDPEGLEREVLMTGQDREHLLYGKTPEFGNALRAIEERVQEYRDTLLLKEVKGVLSDPKPLSDN